MNEIENNEILKNIIIKNLIFYKILINQTIEIVKIVNKIRIHEIILLKIIEIKN